MLDGVRNRRSGFLVYRGLGIVAGGVRYQFGAGVNVWVRIALD